MSGSNPRLRFPPRPTSCQAKAKQPTSTPPKRHPVRWRTRNAAAGNHHLIRPRQSGSRYGTFSTLAHLGKIKWPPRHSDEAHGCFSRHLYRAGGHPLLAQAEAMLIPGPSRPLSELEDMELRRDRLRELIALKLVSPTLSQQIRMAVRELEWQIAKLKNDRQRLAA